MPSFAVAPVQQTFASGGPMLGGVEFRRATSRSEQWEGVGSDQELPSGALRAYDRGRRLVVSLSWSKMTRAELDALAELCLAPFITYANDSGSPEYVMRVATPPTSDAIAGTFPIRYRVDVGLRGRDVSR